MIYRGIVKHGVVELQGDVILPEGTQVNVEPLAAQADEAPAPDDPVFGMSDLAVDTGVEDLATNIDHYLYGHPKASQDG